MENNSSNEHFIEDDLSIRELCRILIRRRWMILTTGVVVAFCASVVVLLLPSVFQGKAVLLPLGKPTNGFQAALGELGGLLPIDVGGGDNPSARLLAILQSRTLTEDVIRHLELLPVLFPQDWDASAQRWRTGQPPTMQSAVKVLTDEVVESVWDDKKGLLSITAEGRDPVLMAAIVNHFVEVLQQALNANAFTQAKKNRVFLEGQLQKNRQDLTLAEEQLQKFEQAYGIVSLDVQAQAAVGALASLEGQIMAKEVQLGVWRRTLTGSSREVNLLQEELQGLRTQLARLQQGVAGPWALPAEHGQASQIFPALDKAPDIKLQYGRLQRDALIQNKLFALLAQQLEQAKIDEARDETSFQILDRAVPPEEPVKPKRLLLMAFSGMLGGFLGLAAAFTCEFLSVTVRTREQVERQIGLSLLAAIPAPGPGLHPRRQLAEARDVSLIPHTSLGESRQEAFRYLHTRLHRLSNGHRIQTVLFANPGPQQEDPAAVLIPLATVAASTGERVLLIDGNLRQPVLHRALRCNQTPGLSDFLVAPAGWEQGVQATGVRNLSFLPAGAATSNAFVAWETSAFEALLACLRKAYDWIFFAAPPVLSCTDAIVLSTKMDATCLMLTYGISRLDGSVNAKAALETVQGKVVGAILTDHCTS